MRDWNHDLYQDLDFEHEDYDHGGNYISRYVVQGSLSVCKACGQAEGDLEIYCPKAKYPAMVLRINAAFSINR